MEEMSYRDDVDSGMYYAYGDRHYIPAVTFADMWNTVSVDEREKVITDEFGETIFDMVYAIPMGNVKGHRFMDIGRYPARGDVVVSMWNKFSEEEKKRVLEMYKDEIGWV